MGSIDRVIDGTRLGEEDSNCVGIEVRVPLGGIEGSHVGDRDGDSVGSTVGS